MNFTPKTPKLIDFWIHLLKDLDYDGRIYIKDPHSGGEFIDLNTLQLNSLKYSSGHYTMVLHDLKK
ncbi:MAG: hypothetical protein KKF44_03685 [Nanoarchaeota archaeon]|nr:hypothetical protein [Nanoarchaeota archaeon]